MLAGVGNTHCLNCGIWFRLTWGWSESGEWPRVGLVEKGTHLKGSMEFGKVESQKDTMSKTEVVVTKNKN